MPLWRIRPAADPADTRWQDHGIYGEVIVRAETPALARLLAGRLEAEELDDEAPAGNESDSWRSAFDDEKLYRVERADPETASQYDAAGAQGVLHWVRRRPPGRP